MIKHIVLLKFKKDIPQHTIQSAFIALGNLRHIIPQIVSFSWGPNNSTEGLNRDYNYGFVMEFANIADRNYYLVHPEHIRVAENVILPALEDGINSALVFDYQE